MTTQTTFRTEDDNLIAVLTEGKGPFPFFVQYAYEEEGERIEFHACSFANRFAAIANINAQLGIEVA